MKGIGFYTYVSLFILMMSSLTMLGFFTPYGKALLNSNDRIWTIVVFCILCLIIVTNAVFLLHGALERGQRSIQNSDMVVMSYDDVHNVSEDNYGDYQIYIEEPTE